mmetsp:Transcript_9701/g.24170  ORF Transcript_9701/g.24170 Transcript_9701/m.24170 type:complete len:241 (-) Transcript_9701:267-989(-)
MILLRSLPEFTTMCIGAIDFLDSMNCKGSILGSIDCNDASWCDSRDEVIESESGSDRIYEEDLSSRYGELLHESMTSSVQNLLEDSSRQLGQHSMSTPRSSDDDIFRCRMPPQEPSSQPLPFNKLNRSSAWIQDDYSFESEQFVEESKMESVRIIHWEDRVNDSDFPKLQYGCGIFRPNSATTGFCGSSKLRRCSAWSLDESSLIICDSPVGRRQTYQMGKNRANIVHWDERVEGTIRQQ